MPDEPADGPERTPDGRWIVVDGRRWRASDPSIPERFRAELVAELMDARRAVGAAKRSGEQEGDPAVVAARARVQDAKVALGERGAPWWEEADEPARADRLRAAMLALARHRSPDSTICPSDVARTVGGDGWRSLMEATRDVARTEVGAGTVEATQRGAALDPDAAWRGPVRIRLRSS